MVKTGFNEGSCSMVHVTSFIVQWVRVHAMASDIAALPCLEALISRSYQMGDSRIAAFEFTQAWIH